MKYFSLVLFCLLVLSGCGRSKEPLQYVLNPLNVHTPKTANLVRFRIGIDEITVPEYLNKSPLSIYSSAYQSTLDENHQWAEAVPGNIKRVIRTNISNLIPNAAVDVAPFDIKFKPDIFIDIHINQFRMDAQGSSMLLADYEIYHGERSKKYFASCYSKIDPVNAASLVRSMNENLNELSIQITQHLREEAQVPVAPPSEDSGPFYLKTKPKLHPVNVFSHTMPKK